MIYDCISDLFGPTATKARLVAKDHTQEPTQPLVLAIDPGPMHSGLALVGAEDPKYVIPIDIVPNGIFLQWLESANLGRMDIRLAAIEQVRSYGGGAGAELYDTVFWSGQMALLLRKVQETVHIPRPSVAHFVTNAGQHTNDAAVRAAITVFYGGSEIAVGTSKKPGKLYGMRGDVSAAVAVGLAGQQYLRFPNTLFRVERYEPNMHWKGIPICK